MRARSLRISILIATCAVAATACTRKTPDSVSRDLPPVTDAATADAGAVVVTAKDASLAADAGPPSPFSLVARQNGRVDLQRIQNGPILATMRGGSGYAHVLSEDGSISLLEPIASHHAETHPGMGWDMGRITGVWPDAVYVEMAIAGGRAETVIEHYLMDVEKRTLTRKRIGGDEHLAVTQKWSDGRVLGWVAESSSVMGPFPTRSGHFTILSGSRPAAMPVLPKKAAAANEDAVIAYESGRIFVMGALDKKDHDYETGYVWEILDGRVKPVKLHDDLELVAIERGRNEREALVIGTIDKSRAFLARFDGSAWVEVKLPFTDAPSSMSIGDDGSVWVTTGHPHHDGKEPSKLWRADFPELRFTVVPTDPSLVLSKVKARNASDVWFAASTAPDLDREALFHTQAAKRELLEFGNEDPQRATLSKKDPPPFYPGCVVPFILLGREDELKEEDVTKLVASLGEWPNSDNGVLVQVKSGKVWGLEIGIEVNVGVPARYRTMASTFATVKAKFPNAKLVCTRGKIEKSLDAPPKAKP